MKNDEQTGGVKGTDATATVGKDGPQSMSRRRILIGGATAAAGAALMMGSPSVFAAGTNHERELRIGWLSPQSGKLAPLAKQDPFILGLTRKALGNKLTIDGKTWHVKFIERDTQSSPSRAAQLTNELITKEHVHLMLSEPTPDTGNPVSDACEAAGIPSLTVAVPLESFFFGRGGKLGQPNPSFHWAFDFFPDAKLWVGSYLAMWGLLKTNKKVGVLYPNDADGNAFRHAFPPILEKHGYQVIDPGPYEDGTTDYATQIALFNRENCQIFNTVGLPPDVNTFWRQAAQQHYTEKCIIAEFTKAGEMPAEVTPLGPLGFGLTTTAFWAPVFPYKSPLTGLTSMELARGYENYAKELWTNQVGPSMALAEMAVAALKASKDPTNRDALRKAISTLDVVTTIGRVNFNTGPYPNTATSPVVGVQWVKPKPGSKYPLDCVTVENASDPNVPIQRKLVPYNQHA